VRFLRVALETNPLVTLHPDEGGGETPEISGTLSCTETAGKETSEYKQK